MANVEISVETNGVVGYYHYTKSISPIKRLYVKSDEDIDDIKISVTSSPEFLLPVEFGGETFYRCQRDSDGGEKTAREVA